jgi:hypothetical protein
MGCTLPVQIKPTYFRDHATKYECLPLVHSPTPRPTVRRIARPPHLCSLHVFTRAQRTRLHLCPKHWLLCHLGLY